MNTQLTEEMVGDTYEDVVGYSLTDTGKTILVTDCEMDTVGYVRQDLVAAVVKILNWVPQKLRGKDDTSVTSALLMNAYEAAVSVVEYATYDDLIGKFGPPPEGTVPIIDAEMDLVMFAPKEKAEVLARVLNWADENAPIGDDDDD